jgi:hypothetical protein
MQRTLKARAAGLGMSLSAYLLSEIREAADRPTLKEMRARLQAEIGGKVRSPQVVSLFCEGNDCRRRDDSAEGG